MVKRKVPNVVRGGIAIPLGNNYYYMRGRKHEYGGIDIGENPRTGIEVEDKEVVHVGNNDLKVYSAQPFLGGLSPAERIIRGDNPIDVFNSQEDYKRRNKLNDDGTRKKRNGGLSRSKDYDSKSKPYPSVKSKDFAGDNRSYPIPTKADAVDALRLAGLHGRNDIKAKVYRRYHELRKKAKYGIDNDIEYIYDKINKKNTSDFKRLRDPNRKSMPAWDKYGAISTNKVSIGTDRNGQVFLYNEIQDNGNGVLLDYTNPIINRFDKYKGMDRAIERGDIIHINSIKDGIEFSKNYKNRYKGYRNGGVYSVTSNGKTSLRYLPKLESNEYKKFAIGGDEDNDIIKINRLTTLNNEADYYRRKMSNSSNDNEFSKNLDEYVRVIKLIKNERNNKHVTTMKSEINDVFNSQFPQVITFEKDGNIYVKETKDSGKDIVNDKEYILDYISAPYRVKDLNDNTEVYIKNPFYNRNIRKYGGKNRIDFRRKYKIGGDNDYYTPDYYNDSLSPQFIINDTSLVPYTYPSLIYGYRYYPTGNYDNGSSVPIISQSEVDAIDKENTPTPTPTSTSRTDLSKLNYKFRLGTNVTNIEQLMLRDLDRNLKPIGNAYNPNYTMGLAESGNSRIKRAKQRLIRRNTRTKTGRPVETFGINMIDLIGAGANTLAALAGFNTNRRMLNDMKYTAQPNLEMAAKLKTNYNINPRLAAVRESLAQTINDVNRNTYSSNVALARNQAALNNALLTADQLYALKENEETNLINTDRMNRQEVANRNVQSYNEWLKDKTTFENNIRKMKSENEVGLYNNLNSAVQNVVNNILKRRSDNNTITAMMAANPDLPIEILGDLGLVTPAQVRTYRKQYPLKKD